MAFKVSNKEFEEAFGSKNEVVSQINTSEKIVHDFLKNLKKYLKEHERFPAAKAMSRWLEKGGVLSAFTCRGDMVEPMISAFRRESVPFVIVQEATGDTGFLIRSKDERLQKKIARYVLKSHANFCRVSSGKDANEHYLHQRIPDKNMIAIGGITEEQLIYLEKACNSVLPGEVIGVDKMEDGTYLISVHGQTAVLGSRQAQGKNFAALLAETLFLFNANVKNDVKKMSSNAKHYRSAKSKGFLDTNGTTQNPVWIVGSENRFVKRTNRGFELGHAEELADDVILEMDMRVHFDDANYESRLNSALLKMTNRKVLYRLSDVIEHFKTKKKYFRDSKLAGEQHLMEEVDLAVANKVRRDAIFVRGNNWGAKLRHYQAEVGKVLVGLRDGKIPSGYRKEQIIGLMDISHRYHLDVHKMTPAIEQIRNTDIYDRPAGPPKIRNVEQEIARHAQNRGVQQPTIERPQIGRDDGRG